MTKIEKWIEEKCPNYKVNIYKGFVEDKSTQAIYKIGARAAAKHILEECGVLEALEEIANECIDVKERLLAQDCLNKIKGEKSD